MATTVKHCQQGLKPVTTFLGLEPIDAVALAIPFVFCLIVLDSLFLAVIVPGLLGGCVRLIKLGKLPGYSFALIGYLLINRNQSAFGNDDVPLYPEVSNGNERKDF